MEIQRTYWWIIMAFDECTLSLWLPLRSLNEDDTLVRPSVSHLEKNTGRTLSLFPIVQAVTKIYASNQRNI
jgi:hypothetical protein